MRAAWWVMAVATGLLPLTGCQWKGGPRPAAAGAATRPAEAWSPRPVAMRVYPSSRFVQDRGQTVLEARVELLDAMNDSVKASGQFQLELLTDPRRGAESPRRLYAWTVPVLSLAEQRRHYDSVTRAYLFRLSLDDLAIPRRDTLLRVMFTPAEGERLEAEATLTGAREGA